MDIRWKPPGKVAKDFVMHREHKDKLPIDIIIGPVGSGKTVSCIIRMLLHIMEQPPDDTGWRRSRWAVVRNTGPMLETTTIPSVLQWLPDGKLGTYRAQPTRHYDILIPSMKVAAQLLFVPLDRPDDIRRLLSLDITGAWINELRQIPHEIVTQLRRRCGRFPPAAASSEVGWAGIIADTNAPEDELHWLCLWSGMTSPPEWMDAMTRQLMARPDAVTIFQQPPGLVPIRDAAGNVLRFEPNPEAENLENLRPGYYESQISGSRVWEILNMVCCEPVRSTDSRPVHPQFRRHVHVSPEPLEADPREPILVGMDFGRTPAAVVAQRIEGRLHVLLEVVGTNVSVREFVSRSVIPAIVDRVGPHWVERIRGWGDPAGAARAGGDDTTVFQHAREAGLILAPAPSQDPDRRQAALEKRLTTMRDGLPAILFDPYRCTALIAGLAGGYRFDEKNPEKVVKNMYSHVCEALEYLCLGADTFSEGRRFQKPINAMGRWDPLKAARAGVSRPPAAR